MDILRWKVLLLNWIDHTNLLDRHGDQELNGPIEDTNIQAFYNAFCDLLDIKRPLCDITEFIKRNYPDFELNSLPGGEEDYSRAVALNDYVYVYSMFLHYGCVICFNKDIQAASQSLSATEQMAVTIFLNHFLSHNVVITRSSLTNGILEAIQSMETGPLAKFYAEDENGNRGGDSFTPKTIKLEKNNREIYRLSCHLDTERYEVSYLEEMVREKEEQLEAMKRREADYLREIEELKRTLIYGADDGEKADELGKKEKLELKTLRKSNAMLEDKVANLLIELNHVATDKSKMLTKLKTMGKDLRSYKDRTSELAQLIEEFNADIAAKDKKISELIDTNMELESFISENRSLLNKNIETMNTSTGSCSSTTNISSVSLRSANLGSCVIDIQLKEKELENEELKEQINSMNEASMGIRMEIERFLEGHPAMREEFKDLPREPAVLEKLPDLLHLLSNLIKDKSQLEDTLNGQITVLLKFREDRDRLAKELRDQTEKSLGMEMELKDLRETVRSYAENQQRSLDTVKYEVKHLQEMNSVLKLEKESFKSGIEKGEEDLYAKIRKIGKLQVVIEKLRFEKRKAENEQKEMETNLQRLCEMKLEEAKGRQMELERRIGEHESLLDVRQRRIKLLEEQRTQFEERLDEQRRVTEELRVKREEAERHAAVQEEVMRREAKEVVERLEGQIVDLRKENVNLEHKIRIISNNIRPSLSVDVVERLRPGTTTTAEGRERETMARRSSLKAQLTSTPRLSMKQKVQLDMELMKRRRISLLSPPDDDPISLSSSESEKCFCRPRKDEKGKSRVTRRDSLIFSSPRRKRKPLSVPRGPTTLDRTAINRLQKLKRQKTFNKARDELPVIDGQNNNNSLLWDDEYDMHLDLPLLVEGSEEFVINDDQEAIQENFDAILEAERCDGEDLFEEIIKGTPRATAIIVTDGGGGENKGEKAPLTPQPVTPPLQRRSLDQSATSFQNKSYSINSGMCNESKLPMASVVHFSPRDERTVLLAKNRNILNGLYRADLNLIPLSQQNLLQLIVIVLVGIFFCIFYQNIVY